MCLKPNVWKQEFCQEIILPTDPTQRLRGSNRQKNFSGQGPQSQSVWTSTKQQPSEDGGTFRINCRWLDNQVIFFFLPWELGSAAGSQQVGPGCRRKSGWPTSEAQRFCSYVLRYSVDAGEQAAVDVNGGGGGGREQLWMRSRRPGTSGGALQTAGPPMDKERRERFSGSAPEIPQSRCQSRNPANCYNNCDSLTVGSDKVYNFQLHLGSRELLASR